jgi:hypothetical protein
MTIRLTNGSGKTVDLVGTATVTYGTDGQEAKTSYVDDQDIAEGLGSESFARQPILRILEAEVGRPSCRCHCEG